MENRFASAVKDALSWSLNQAVFVAEEVQFVL